MPYKKRDDILAGKMTEASTQTTINNFSKQEITGENELVTITGTNGQLNINDANIYVSDNAGIVSNQLKQKMFQLNQQLLKMRMAHNLCLLPFLRYLVGNLLNLTAIRLLIN